jgi:Mechanosensitive ion channel, conserved TM helix
MNSPLQDLFYNVIEKIIGYLPNLVAGLLLIAVGWFLGWLLKRIIMQVCRILRLERFIQRFRWGENLSKGDVKYGLYNSIGNFGGFIIFLIFLSKSLSVLNLTLLSDLFEKGILFLPKFIIAVLILGLGWLIAKWISVAIRKNLLKEEFPRPGLIARFSKAVLILFFSAMALTELDIAREIVIIGFSTIIITLSAIVVVLTARGGKNLVSKILQTLDEE